MSRNDRGSNSSLIVRNLPFDSNSDELRDIFKEFGRLKDVYIPLDYYTKSQRGFAYVQFEDCRDAEDALHELNGRMYLNQEMRIDIARGDRKTPVEMGRKEGRNRYDRDDRRRDYDDHGRSRRYDDDARRYEDDDARRYEDDDARRYEDDDDIYRRRDRSRLRSCNRRRTSLSRSDARYSRGNYEITRNYPRPPPRMDHRAVRDQNFRGHPEPNDLRERHALRIRYHNSRSQSRSNDVE